MNKTLRNIFKGDKVIWVVFLLLCLISLIEVFSASSHLTYGHASFIDPILKHAATIIGGVVAAVIIVNIECKYFKVATPVLIFISVATLVWVLIGGENINGANRVIRIGSQTFQPSEIAKGTVVLAVAQILSAMQTDKGADKKAFIYILIVTIPFAGLIVTENLSTAALLCAVVFLMMVIGRVPMRQLAKLVGFCIGLVALVIAGVMVLDSASPSTPPDSSVQVASNQAVSDTPKGKEKEEKNFIASIFHRAQIWKNRITDFSSEERIPIDQYDLNGGDAQVAHANIAIVTSNYIGKGPGNSEERDFLAQAYSDFIYAIIIEEMGLLGAAGVVFLYIILLFRTAVIASRCDNNFPAFLAMGLALLLVVQASFNMMVAVGMVPVTGQPLPLISKGGTSTIINGAYIGAILSVSRWAKRKKRSSITSDNVVTGRNDTLNMEPITI